MLACIQRQQNLTSQRLACTAKSLDVPPPSPSSSSTLRRQCVHKGEPAPMVSRYPSPAELDAFAQKTANSPLSIKIFPTDIRVPQHKQLNKIVNGLDTTGQHYGSYSHHYSGGHQGLLAIVKASVVVKGVVKNSEGRRTKHTNTSVAPYNNPLNNGFAVRHRHKAYHISSCKPPDVPIETLCSRMSSGDQSRVPQSELAEVQSLMRQMSGQSQAVHLGGEAQSSPSLQAVAAVPQSESDFILGVPPQSSLAYTGAVLPTQSATKVGYMEKGDYATWHHKQQMRQQVYPGVRMYTNTGQSPESCLSLAQSSQIPYRLPMPTRQERVSGSNMQGEFSVRQYYAPLWDNISTSSSDCYTSQVLASGPHAARPGELPLPHHHLHPNRHQLHLAHSQAYSAEQNLCCGLPSSNLCHAAVLSSSLQSLECLISEIHPPCIKERMLGRGYEAMGMPPLLEHHQQNHIQLPVYR
ncbi:protein FAM222A-like [Synchiropus splendidus]|uniref:protein FAM222A-like n=1 Tax=Synchiropus splendidus TaxID=270530 RepID=UPI00237EABBE|nr:protein FAM222A-like [Synchiropus splendidus]XP_053733361.1 protein FAM222A-like [Synchiropus splendidus]